jgi:D-arabinose 1-dehydrogenase-like Zn-dependent alcohol dehydrogenase
VRAALVDALPASAPLPGDVADAELNGPGELIIAVEACGICGTDLHILAGESYRPALPFVLGHEPVGVVVDASAGAEEWLGRRIAVSLFTGDGTCELCAAGDERLCEHLVSITGVLRAWGGFAERLRIRCEQAVDVPDALTSDDAAALVDAGPTAVNALRAIRRRPGRVAIVGGGPVGWLLAELLRGEGRDTVVVERNGGRRGGLRALGHHVVEGVGEIEGPIGVVAECAGSPDVPGWALTRLQPRGLFLVVGYARAPGLDLAPVAQKELTIGGVRSGSRDDLVEALARAARGEVRPPPVARWPLERIADAFAALRSGDVKGKAVIVVTPRNAEGGAWTSSSSR